MDKFEEMNNRLREVSECFASWKQNGISEEILITWFMAKMKVSRKIAEKIVNSYEEFYDEFLRKEMLDKMESENEN